MTEPLTVAVDARGVATLTLARPERHNALDETLIAALTAAAARIGADPAVRAVILAGEGPSFCAGGDLAWMRAQADADRAGRIAAARRLAALLAALDGLPKPLVARVHGPAYGGGVGLLAVCDAAVAADTAVFALTEVRLGLIPATIAPYVVGRLAPAATRRLFYSGRRFGAAEAEAAGLLARVVPADALDAAVEEEVAPYLSAAPGAIAAAKRLARSLSTPVDEAVVARTVEALADTWEGPEAAEGIAAFFARRPPPWAG
jgi:methylglutaconyl-CoA hydratase